MKDALRFSPSGGIVRRLERIRDYVVGLTGAELAAHAAGAIVIALVPGALMAWLAWRLLAARRAS